MGNWRPPERAKAVSCDNSVEGFGDDVLRHARNDMASDRVRAAPSHQRPPSGIHRISLRPLIIVSVT